MHNVTYHGGFDLPRPESTTAVSIPGTLPAQTFHVGIKTITRNRAGLAVVPHKAVVFEISEGHEAASFALPPKRAREVAERIREFADAIEEEKV